MDIVELLRHTTEDDVERALEQSQLGEWPQDPAGLLAVYHRILDAKLSECIDEHA